jgi:hypothetical protein
MKNIVHKSVPLYNNFYVNYAMRCQKHRQNIHKRCRNINPPNVNYTAHPLNSKILYTKTFSTRITEMSCQKRHFLFIISGLTFECMRSGTNILAKI